MEHKDYDLSTDSINKYDKKTLEAICRLRKLKVSGNKSELQNRILTSLGELSFSPPKKSSPDGQVNQQVNQDLNFDTSPEALFKYDKKTLEAICRSKKLKISGKKEELLQRILAAENNNEGETLSINKTPTKKTPTKKTPTKKTPTKKTPTKKSTPVIDKLEEKSYSYDISRNKWGNYEHPESNLVFDPQTKKVLGRQLDGGEIVNLTSEDIELCKKYKFEYSIPLNLSIENDIDALAEDIKEILALEEDEGEEDDEFDEEYEEDEEILT